MPNPNPPPVYDDAAVIQIAYQDMLKKMFTDLVLEFVSPTSGGIPQFEKALAASVVRLRQYRDAAVKAVSAPQTNAAAPGSYGATLI